MAANMADLLQILVDRGGSDLHITSGTYPQLRINGRLTQLTQFEQLTPQDTQRLAYSILNETQKQKFEEESELDLSFGIQGLARFRCNVFRQRGAVGAAIRLIPYKIRSFDELGLPPIVQQLADRPKGLVLVTGPTGSGKSTTLAAMIDKVNTERHEHIVTIEDPIEFVHPHKACLVNQREVYSDTLSFQKALKYLLRPDDEPDHRRVPDQPAGAGPGPARPRRRGGPLANPDPQGRRWARDGDGDHGGHARHPEPDPRGKDPPGVLRDRDGEQIRDADDEPVARRAREAEADHARGGAEPVDDRRGAAPASRRRRWRLRASRAGIRRVALRQALARVRRGPCPSSRIVAGRARESSPARSRPTIGPGPSHSCGRKASSRRRFRSAKPRPRPSRKSAAPSGTRTSRSIHASSPRWSTPVCRSLSASRFCRSRATPRPCATSRSASRRKSRAAPPSRSRSRSTRGCSTISSSTCSRSASPAVSSTSSCSG